MKFAHPSKLNQKNCKEHNNAQKKEKPFCFHFISEFESKKELTNLDAQKTPSLSDLPAWALIDGCKEIYPHLS